MHRSPISVRIVGWTLIASGIVRFVCSSILSGVPDSLGLEQALKTAGQLPMWALILIGSVGALVRVASGIGMLNAQNWARWMWVGWCVVFLPIDFRYWGVNESMPVTVLKIGTVIVLFLPAANEYFARRLRQ